MGTRSIIRVFEHQCLKVDAVIEDVRFNTSHLKALEEYYGVSCPYFSLIHNGVKFREYVGVLQIGSLTIEVLPKTDQGNENPEMWHKFLIKMLRAAGILDISETSQSSLKLKRNSILDLYIEIFVKEARYLIQMGLIKKYRKLEGNRYDLKGALNFSKNIRENLVHAERFYVQYTNYNQNNHFNRIILKTLKILKIISPIPGLQSEIESLILDFPEMPDLAITDATFEKLVYDRKSLAYTRAINISRLLLLRYHPDIRTGRNYVLALMFNMNKLWEKYVFKQLRKQLSGKFLVKEQVGTDFWQPDSARMVKIYPDIVIYDLNDKPIVVLDTKWKIQNGYKPNDNDLKQMLAYNYYFDCQHSALLYPTSDQSKMNVVGKYQKDNNLCSLIFLPLIENPSNSDISICDIYSYIYEIV